jgi:hypothetical protein
LSASKKDKSSRILPLWRKTHAKNLFALALILAGATSLIGAKTRDFQTGKLIGITADERLINGTSYRWAIFTVQVADVVYTARGGRVRLRSGDIGQGLIAGDAVKVAIDGADIILLKPDGRGLKAKIIKRKRPSK